MTDGMVVILGQVALAIYAILLGVGGYVGYKKAGSRISFGAGFVSAVLVAIALAYSFVSQRLSFWMGLIVSVILFMVFIARYLRKRKFMPSGVLTLLSLAMVGIMIWAVVALADTPVENKSILPVKKKNSETTRRLDGFMLRELG